MVRARIACRLHRRLVEHGHRWRRFGQRMLLGGQLLHAAALRQPIRMRERQPMHTADGDHQQGDQLPGVVLVDGHRQDGRIGEAVAHMIVHQIRVQTDFEQFEAVVMRAPVDEPIARVQRRRWCVAEAAGPFGHLDVLQGALRGACLGGFWGGWIGLVRCEPSPNITSEYFERTGVECDVFAVAAGRIGLVRNHLAEAERRHVGTEWMVSVTFRGFRTNS